MPRFPAAANKRPEVDRERIWEAEAGGQPVAPLISIDASL
jgi:hypothetical protein